MARLPPWRGSLVIPPIGDAVREALAHESTCVPPLAIALTYYSRHHSSLRELQLQRIRNLRCFMLRLVTVCYGVRDDNSSNPCVYAPSFDSREATFRHGAYHELIWAKWRMLHDALTTGGAERALFVDSDVVLFRNPFHALRNEPAYDISFQGELACQHASCRGGRPSETCHLNGGVLLLRSALLVAKVIQQGEPDFRMANAADKGGPPHGKSASRALDQDTADAVMRMGGFTSCHLPSEWFIGFCAWSFGYNKGNRSFVDGLKPCDLVGYHAHCLVGARTKVTSMQRMLDKTAHCDASSGSTRRVGGNAEAAGADLLGRWGPKAPDWELRPPKRRVGAGGGTKAVVVHARRQSHRP